MSFQDVFVFQGENKPVQQNTTVIGNQTPYCGHPNQQVYPNINMPQSCIPQQEQNSSIQALSQMVNQSLAYVNQATNDLKVSQEENQMLRMHLENMKRTKKEQPDLFTINSSNIGICVHNGNRTTIGRIKINSVRNYAICDENSYKNVFQIAYQDTIGNPRTTVITEKELTEKKLVSRFPGFTYVCSSSKMADRFLAWYITSMYQNDFADMIPYHAGFSTYMKEEKEYAKFYCNDGSIPPEILLCCSENIRSNYMTGDKKAPEKIKSYVEKYLNKPEKRMLYIISLCGIFSSILDDIHYLPKQIVVISYPNTDSARQAAFFLQGFNRGQTPISFDTNKAKIRRVFQSTKDDTIVINDCNIIDNEARRNEALHYILALHEDNETLPHCTAILSNFASSVLEKDNKIYISLSDDFYTEMTQEEEHKMCYALNCITRYLIDIACENFSEFKKFILSTCKRLIQQKNIVNEICQDIHTELPNMQSNISFAAIQSIASFVELQLSHSFNSNDVSNFLLHSYIEANAISADNDDVIVNDFSAVLRQCIQSGDISIVLHSKEMNYVADAYQLIVKDDLIMLEESTIRNVILPKMKTTESVHNIIKALDHVGLLHATKKKRYPLTVYQNGTAQRVTFLAMESEGIFDKTLCLKIQESKYAAWFSETAPAEHLLPIATNRLGEKVYQRYEFEKADNMHCFYLGQSGSGKTNSLTERMCNLFRAGQKIVILDTSDSFTREAILQNLSAGGDDHAKALADQFITENVTFHKVEELGVPVDLLNLQYPSVPETKRKIIDAIVSAHIQNMGKVQKAALRTGISDLMENRSVNMIDLYERLTDESMSDSLVMQFEDMLSCFLEYASSDRSWGEFFDDSKGIIVISTDAVSCSSGSALVDMLLMSLFYTQRNNPTQHIAVFIDEIQNQNFSPNGAISQILKEGRKYHISLNYATQFLPSNNKDLLKVINLAALRVFLQPDTISAKSISKTIGVPVTELTSMEQGECYINGNLYNHKEHGLKNGVVHGYTFRNFVPFQTKF